MVDKSIHPPKSFRKKPLAEWPEDQKHSAVLSPEDKDESNPFGGSTPESGIDYDLDQINHDFNLTEGNGDEPEELNIASKVEDAEKHHS